MSGPGEDLTEAEGQLFCDEGIGGERQVWAVVLYVAHGLDYEDGAGLEHAPELFCGQIHGCVNGHYFSFRSCFTCPGREALRTFLTSLIILSSSGSLRP